MSDEIKVYVIDKGRKFLYLMHTDPTTGKKMEKSAKTANRSKADKAAGVWEDELRSGRYQKPNRMTWEAFREHYSANALPGLARRTGETYESSLNVFEAKCSPARLADVTTARLTAFVTTLRTENAAEATIAHHLRHLKAAMRWAHRQGLLLVLPQFTMPKRAKGSKVMRGRPISLEEFERMLAVTPGVVENVAAESWKFYLRGLWMSGLRLAESLTLRWDDGPNAIVVDLDGEQSMFRIPAEVEKGNQDRELSVSPEFVKLLETVPEDQRRGRVFKLLAPNGSLFRVSTWEVSRIVSKIGKKAGIIVDERKKGDEVVRKYASCHDLRRAFAKRWSAKLQLTQLSEVMRHASPTTTLKYYVGTDPRGTAKAMWNGFVDTSVDTSVSDERHSTTEELNETRKQAK